MMNSGGRTMNKRGYTFLKISYTLPIESKRYY